mmetsp:Transcript_135538/g.433583  ORF Transcript_135538/g.433583 Transcript_135538/m.433583 type:complete len:211 (+) Transcript_135538:540-1172(+)
MMYANLNGSKRTILHVAASGSILKSSVSDALWIILMYFVLMPKAPELPEVCWCSTDCTSTPSTNGFKTLYSMLSRASDIASPFTSFEPGSFTSMFSAPSSNLATCVQVWPSSRESFSTVTATMRTISPLPSCIKVHLPRLTSSCSCSRPFRGRNRSPEVHVLSKDFRAQKLASLRHPKSISITMSSNWVAGTLISEGHALRGKDACVRRS